MSFGEWLRAKINEKSLSNAEVARRAGVSATYIGNLVRDYSQNTKTGKVKPSEAVVERIANALDVPVDQARNAAGYAISEKKKKVTSIPELIEALEAVGIVDTSFFGGTDKFDEFTPDDFEELKERIMADVGITLRRKRKN